MAIPSIPPRTALLARALTSVAAQSRLPDAISVAFDFGHDGAAVTRNRAWRMLDTDAVAFVDDDDELCPEHLAVLEDALAREDADLVYPWFEVVGGTDPMPANFGRPWNSDDPVQTTVTCLWRREALEMIDGFPVQSGGFDALGNRMGEEYLAVCALNDMGGKIVHVPERTWRWHHHFANTSGLAERW